VAEVGAGGEEVPFDDDVVPVVVFTTPVVGLMGTPVTIGFVNFVPPLDGVTGVVEATPVEAVVPTPDGGLEPVVVDPAVGGPLRLNPAVTVVGVVMAKLQGLADPHPPPLKLVNAEPLLGTAITVKDVPGLYCAQLAPHGEPVGVIATTPLPFPLLAVVRLTLAVGVPELGGFWFPCTPVPWLLGFWDPVGGGGLVVLVLLGVTHP